MSESQGYKLGMKLGLSDKSALFSKVRRDGSKREVELLMGSGSANTAFRRGLKSAAFELKQGKRRPAARQKTTRKKTTRQRLTTAKRPAAKRKSSSRKSSRKDRSAPQDWNQKETTKWFATLGEKIGNFKVWDSWVYAVVDQPVELRASYASGSLEDPGMVWEITQVKGQPAVLTGQESGRGRSVERYTGTLAQMKKKLAAISRRKSSSGKGSTLRITRSKPARMMSEQKFWPIVRSLQWRTARSGVPDMEKRREKFQSLVSAGQRKPFDARLKQLRQKLDESIQAWEAKAGKQIPLGGDGYRDLLNHIIGLGKTEYTQTLRSPKRAFDRAKSRDFFESFVYITFAPSRKRKNPRRNGSRRSLESD